MLGQNFWGSRLVSGSLSVFAPPGAVPVVGGYMYLSVLRSPGVTPQECRAAHGPLHPAVTSPPRLCWCCIWFLLGFSGMDVGYSVWFFSLWGWHGVWFVALQDLTPVCHNVCCPLFLFLWLFGWFRRRHVLSSFLFFSGAGETQTFLVWVSPCVLFLVHADSIFNPYVLLDIYP